MKTQTRRCRTSFYYCPAELAAPEWQLTHVMWNMMTHKHMKTRRGLNRNKPNDPPDIPTHLTWTSEETVDR